MTEKSDIARELEQLVKDAQDALGELEDWESEFKQEELEELKGYLKKLKTIADARDEIEHQKESKKNLEAEFRTKMHAAEKHAVDKKRKERERKDDSE
jgi:hypothetical protein